MQFTASGDTKHMIEMLLYPCENSQNLMDFCTFFGRVRFQPSL